MDDVYPLYFVQLLPYHFTSQIYILKLCLSLPLSPQIWMVIAVRINLLSKVCSFKTINLNELRQSAKLNEQTSLLLILVRAVYEYDEA